MHIRRSTLCALFVVVACARPSAGASQKPQASGTPASSLAGTTDATAPQDSSDPQATAVAIQGPPAPVAPATVNRDDKGNATIRAVRVSQFNVDGRLDDEVYGTVPPITDLLQQQPRPGELATEKTEVWFFFDNKNLYISARCYDTRPERNVATELRRDNINIFRDDNFTVVLDTFYDRRNAFVFQTNPLGALRDQLVVEDVYNESWNTVWDVRTSRFEGGWNFEMEIPFKSLRYRQSGAQVWGVNFRRIVRWKNEFSTLVPVPPQYVTLTRLDFAGSLVGLETPSETRNLELKPYVVSSAVTDLRASQPFSNRIDKNAGFDVKYGLTRGLIADLTVNTDFAQVEEDLQQVNLTRFNLLFPEKRDFFLEGQGIFAFGGVAPGGFGPGSGGPNSVVPVMFFSRRIGLNQGQAVPVIAGGRLTGKAGPYGIGVLSIGTDDKSEAKAVATNFSVIRIKRDVLRRSNIGIIATRRAPTAGAQDSNMVMGVDANLFFFDALVINNYFARADTSGLEGRDTSYRSKIEYGGDRYGLVAEHLMVDENFNPEVGFMRREDFRRTFGQARFSPRFRGRKLLRKLTWQGSWDYFTDARNTVVENRTTSASFGMEFNNSDTWTVLEYADDYEWLPRNFEISRGVVVPGGGYRYQTLSTSYFLGQQRKVSGRLAAAYGSFYDGTKTEASYSGRVAFTPRFAVEPGVSLNWVDIPYGSFNAYLASTRIIVTPTPRIFVSSLIQYNPTADTLNSSVRLRWEYIPGSELFLVYSDGRNTLESDPFGLINRSIAVKVTRLLRF